MSKVIKLERKAKFNENGTVTLNSNMVEEFKSTIEYEAWVSQVKAKIASKKNELSSAKLRLKYDPKMDGRKKAKLKAFAKQMKEAADFLNPLDAVEEVEIKERELEVLGFQIPMEEK